jgi:hypothetical protein
MSELRRPLASFGDDELGAELRALAAWLDTPASRPVGAPDPARRARLRIEAGESGAGRSWWPFGRGARRGPAWRRSLVLAVVALGVLAAIAGAIGFGVPGIRIIFTAPTPSPSASPQASSPGSLSPSPSSPATVAPSAGPLGSDLDLGFLTTPSEASSMGGFPVALPTSSSIGAPDTTWFTEGRVTFAWRTQPGLPETRAAGVGLLLTEFRGSVNEEFFQKMIGPGSTVTPVMIGDVAGWWISGEPHEIVYLDPQGEIIADTRRVAGDTLLWTRGDLTFRLETSLDRGAAIALAETIR